VYVWKTVLSVNLNETPNILVANVMVKLQTVDGKVFPELNGME
jgi:hypothetical protein